MEWLYYYLLIPPSTPLHICIVIPGILSKERGTEMDTSAHTPTTYTPINCDQSTYFCLQISGQVRRSLYTGALCEGDRFTSIGHPDTAARWTHTHTHK